MASAVPAVVNTPIAQAYQYIFGKSFLIAPVTESGVTNVTVYVPKDAEWFDFWTGKYFKGGQTILTASPREIIPVYVKTGSIIPIGKFMQYTAEKSADNLEIRIYKGPNTEFNLYEDEGDGCNYEKGNYSIISFKWDEKGEVLTIGDRK